MWWKSESESLNKCPSPCPYYTPWLETAEILGFPKCIWHVREEMNLDISMTRNNLKVWKMKVWYRSIWHMHFSIASDSALENTGAGGKPKHKLAWQCEDTMCKQEKWKWKFWWHIWRYIHVYIYSQPQSSQLQQSFQHCTVHFNVRHNVGGCELVTTWDKNGFESESEKKWCERTSYYWVNTYDSIKSTKVIPDVRSHSLFLMDPTDGRWSLKWLKNVWWWVKGVVLNKVRQGETLVLDTTLDFANSDDSKFKLKIKDRFLTTFHFINTPCVVTSLTGCLVCLMQQYAN